MKTRVALQITERERDALLTLDVCRAAWPTFGLSTWESLARKGLVEAFTATQPKPVLSEDGEALIPYLRRVNAVYAPSVPVGEPSH